MSTILEALRKSERARRAGQVPVYGNASESHTPVLLRWSALLAGIALLAALVALVWLMQRRPPEIVVETAPPASQELAQGAATTHTPTGAVESSSAPVAAGPAVTNVKSKNTAETVRLRTEIVPAPATPVVQRPPSMATRTSNEVPLWTSLPESERAGLPPLRVNIHVYTPDESQRILYINNEPRVRGEEVAPGVTVEEIVPEGAIVRFRGQRYLLPRPT